LALYRDGCGLQFLTPAAEAFSMPLGQLRGVTASYMVAIVVKDSLELFDEDLIALDLEGESEAWTRRARGLARRSGMAAGP
jgi:hypothetical protein